MLWRYCKSVLIMCFLVEIEKVLKAFFVVFSVFLGHKGIVLYKYIPLLLLPFISNLWCFSSFIEILWAFSDEYQTFYNKLSLLHKKVEWLHISKNKCTLPPYLGISCFSYLIHNKAVLSSKLEFCNQLCLNRLNLVIYHTNFDMYPV